MATLERNTAGDVDFEPTFATNTRGGFAVGDWAWVLHSSGVSSRAYRYSHSGGVLTYSPGGNYSLTSSWFYLGSTSIDNYAWILFRAGNSYFLYRYEVSSGVMLPSPAGNTVLAGFSSPSGVIAASSGDYLWVLDVDTSESGQTLKRFTHSNGLLTRSSAGDIVTGLSTGNTNGGGFAIEDSLWVVGPNGVIEGYSESSGTLTRDTSLDPTITISNTLRGGFNIESRGWVLESGRLIAFDYITSNIYLGATRVDKLYVGSTTISRVYAGSTKVFG